MHKKILAICAALVAIGILAIPAVASASVTLREGGTKVEPGSKILATGDEEAIFSGGEGFSEVNVKCTNNSMTGTVAKNDSTTVEGTIESASFKGTQAEEKCSGGFLLGNTRVTIPGLTNEGGTRHWCVKNIPGEDKFEVQGRSCGTTEGQELTFILDGATATCIYTRTTAVTGTFTTTTGANPTTLSVTGEPTFTKETGSSSLCPEQGKIKKMKFTLSTDPGAALQMDDVL